MSSQTDSSHSSEQLQAKEFIREYMSAGQQHRNMGVGTRTEGRGHQREVGRAKSDRRGGEGGAWRKGVESEGRDNGRSWKQGGRKGQHHQQAQRSFHQLDEATPSLASDGRVPITGKVGGQPEVGDGSSRLDSEASNAPTPNQATPVGSNKGWQPNRGVAEGKGEGPRSKGDSTHHDERRARQVKDKHKASRANHSRKAMADKKRRGGMV